MPKWTHDKIDFRRMGRRVIEADFSGGDSSSEGGVLLDLFGRRASCHRFWANLLRLLLASSHPMRHTFVSAAQALAP